MKNSFSPLHLNPSVMQKNNLCVKSDYTETLIFSNWCSGPLTRFLFFFFVCVCVNYIFGDISLTLNL